MRHREVQHRGPHHARPVETAAGLGRRTPTNQSAFRRSVPDLATRQVKSRLLFTHADSTSHPVARREPLPPRQRLAGRFELSRPRPGPHGLPRASPCRRERCVSPTSATDLRHEHPARCPIPDGEPPGGASLDGEPPASASLRPSRSASSRPEPRLTRLVRALRVPGGASIESSSAPCFPPAAFSAAERACSSTSDALCRDRPARARPLGLARVDCRQAPLPPPPRQRQPLRRNQDAFPRRSLAEIATRTAHEHNHEPSDPGSTSPTWLAQLALDRQGWGPIRRIDRRIRMTPVLPFLRVPSGHTPCGARPCGPRRTFHPDICRVVPSQGPAGSASTAPLASPDAPPSFALRR
jgi:hypothetical protein